MVVSPSCRQDHSIHPNLHKPLAAQSCQKVAGEQIQHAKSSRVANLAAELTTTMLMTTGNISKHLSLCGSTGTE